MPSTDGSAERQGGIELSCTINQVAKRAGVSSSTVSYVLSGNRSISKPTQVRVRQAIEDLHYKPHAGARSLRGGKTNVVALVVPLYDWASEPVLMPYVYGVVDGAREHGWNVMLVTATDGGTDLDEVVVSKMVDRVVLMEVRVDDDRLKALERLGLPAVSLGLPCCPVNIPFVDLDFEAAGQTCVEYLVGLGHRHIGLLASPPGTFDKGLGYAHRLWRSVAGALEGAGLPFHGLPLEPTIDGAHRALDVLFRQDPALGAVVLHNEPMIDVVMQALLQRGKSVPDDISVIAIAPAELTKHVVPSLTYIDVPAVEMGRTAVRMLVEQGPGALLPATLVPGGTVAPPRATSPTPGAAGNYLGSRKGG